LRPASKISLITDALAVYDSIISTTISLWFLSRKVFKLFKQPGEKLEVLMSFGGLLLSLQGQANEFANIQLDSKMYVLIKKT